MSTRRLFVAVATTTALTMSAVSITAGPAAGTPLPEPKPHLLGPTHAIAALIAVKELKQQYTATRLPSVHNTIVLILHSPVSAVL